MPRTVLECQVSKIVNSDTCPRPATGAGKTTTMCLLTGLIAPDGGSAMVGGFDIVKDRDAMRQNLGVRSPGQLCSII
jgi:ABC-type Na+ transport system ATPase subunit NatA